MTTPAGVLAVLTLASLSPSLLQAQRSPQGVWTIVEAWGEDPTSGAWRFADVEIQPSLFIFLDGHYSMAYVGGDEPRPLMPAEATRSTLTPKQAAAVWMPYTSNSGSFEVVGSSLVIHPTVALVPNFMEEGSERTYGLDWDGADMLLRLDRDGMWYVLKLRRLPER